MINDGYSDFKATVPAFGQSPAVTIVYRPALSEETNAYRHSLALRPGAEATLALLVGHLCGWDITNRTDRPEPITEKNLRRLPPRLVERMAAAVTTDYTVAMQRTDEQNLAHGVGLYCLHPEIFNTSCDFCETHIRNKGTGARDGEERWLKAPAGYKTPCANGGPLHHGPGACPKIPASVKVVDRTRAAAIDISDRNWRAFVFHRECQAVCSFPDDALVRRNARIISEVLEQAREMKESERYARLEMLVGVMAMKVK